MVSILVLAILLGFAVPTFREFTRNNSVTAAQNDLVTSLNLARSEALRRSRPVSVCASADGTTCGAATDWQTGWIVFTDRGTAGTIDVDDALIQAWQSPNAAALVFNTASSFAQYLPTGLRSGGVVTIDIKYTGCVGNRKRRITIRASGAVDGQLVACP